MHDETLDSLVEALMPIVFGPPIRRMGRRWLIRLPRRQARLRSAWRMAADLRLLAELQELTAAEAAVSRDFTQRT